MRGRHWGVLVLALPLSGCPSETCRNLVSVGLPTPPMLTRYADQPCDIVLEGTHALHYVVGPPPPHGNVVTCTGDGPRPYQCQRDRDELWFSLGGGDLASVAQQTLGDHYVATLRCGGVTVMQVRRDVVARDCTPYHFGFMRDP